MKLKVLSTALIATVLSLLITETAQAQPGRGYYNRGRQCGNGYVQRGGGWSNWSVPRPPVQVRINAGVPRGYYGRSYGPGCNNGYYSNRRRGGYTTSYSTTTYYNNGYNNGYYGGYNNGYRGNCGNGGYRRW